MVSQVRFLEERASEAEERIELLMGIGRSCSPSPACRWRQGPRCVAEVGDVSRFRSAAALVSYAGLNSSVSQSGQFDSGAAP